MRQLKQLVGTAAEHGPAADVNSKGWPASCQLPIGSWSARYRLWPDRKRACPSAAHWHLAGRLTQGPERPDASERSMLAVWARRYPAVAGVGHSQVGRCRAGVLYPRACWGPLGLQAAMSMTCGPRIQSACAQRRGPADGSPDQLTVLCWQRRYPRSRYGPV